MDHSEVTDGFKTMKLMVCAVSIRSFVDESQHRKEFKNNNNNNDVNLRKEKKKYLTRYLKTSTPCSNSNSSSSSSSSLVRVGDGMWRRWKKAGP